MSHLVLALLLSIAAVESQPCDKPPKLDGVLDDACWAGGGFQSGFTILNKVDVKADVQTHFQFAHDGGHLYLAARLDEPHMDKLKAEATDRDGHVYRDDCIEIMLDANGDKTTHFQFVVNSLGTLWDSQRRQGGHVHTVKWNCPGFRAVPRKYDDHWTIEIAIPLADLSLDAGSKGTWGFNVARERHAGGDLELTTFTPLTGGFHAVGEYARLTLHDADVDAYLWEVCSPFDTRTAEHDGGVAYLGKTFIVNRTGQFQFLTITAELDTAGGKSQKITVGLDANEEKPIDLAVPAGDNGPAVLTLSIAKRRGGDVLAVRRYPVNISYTPLSIELAYPAYRDNIYATQAVGIRGVVRCSLAQTSRNELRLWLGVRRANGDLKFENGHTPQVEEANPFRFLVSDMSVGDYNIVAELFDKGGKTVHRAERRLRRLPKAENEVRLDANMVTRINGEPFLPFGWFSIMDNLWTEAAGEGYNVVVDYNAYFKKDDELKKWLDKAHAAGLKVVIYCYPKRSMVNAEPMARPLGNDEAESIRQFVRKWKTHPALLGWYIADEPELRPCLPSRLDAVRDVCAEEDPYHPTIMLNDTISGIGTYIGGGDVMMPDPYPLFVSGGHAASSIGKVGKFMRTVAEVGQGRRGAWITPQAFNYGDSGAVNNRAPNFAELRNMMYQAVNEGTTGFLWYTHYHAVTYPDILAAMRYLAKEAKLLEPVILAPHVSKKLQTKLTGGAVHRRVGDHDYIIAVSNETDAVDATVTLPDGAPSDWHVLGEARKIKTFGGKIADRFDTYGVHIYTTNADIAGQVSLTQVKSDGGEVKSGNLAHQSRGVTVSASSAHYAKANLQHTINGVDRGLGWQPKMPFKDPQWCELDFGKTVTVGRVVLAAHHVGDAHVEINGKKVAELKSTGEEQHTATWDAGRYSKLRIVVTRADGNWMTVREVEAYER